LPGALSLLRGKVVAKQKPKGRVKIRDTSMMPLQESPGALSLIRGKVEGITQNLEVDSATEYTFGF